MVEPIIYRGYRIRLNEDLAREQGIGSLELEAIAERHKSLADAFHDAAATSDRHHLRGIARRVEELEFHLQRLWRFDQDASYHTHWLRIPGCTCPVDANIALRGHKLRLIAKNCPVFGDAVRFGPEFREDGMRLLATDKSDPPRTLPQPVPEIDSAPLGGI